jgi:hypothetical protein
MKIHLRGIMDASSIQYKCMRVVDQMRDKKLLTPNGEGMQMVIATLIYKGNLEGDAPWSVIQHLSYDLEFLTLEGREEALSLVAPLFGRNGAEDNTPAPTLTFEPPLSAIPNFWYVRRLNGEGVGTVSFDPFSKAYRYFGSAYITADALREIAYFMDSKKSSGTISYGVVVRGSGSFRALEP